MKYITLSLGLSTASLPVIEWSLEQTLEHYSEGMNAHVKIEIENLVNELRATQQQVIAGTIKTA